MPEKKQSFKQIRENDGTASPHSSSTVRAAGYVRVSQERNMINGYGLEAQVADIKRYAKYKNWKLVKIYRETGVSGYLPAASLRSSEDTGKGTRAVLDKLLHDARSGAFDVVVFPSIDRAARSVLHMIEIDDALREVNVSVVFIRESIDTSTAMGQFFRNICASIAQLEGELIYERLLKGKQAKRANGGYCGGFVPYGYRSETGSYVVNEEEAEVVRRIFRLRLQGKSLWESANEISASGVKVPRGRKWQHSTIRRILNHPFCAGYFPHKGVLRRGSHEPIIDVETFNAVQRVFYDARNKQLHEARRIQLPVEDEDSESESGTRTG